MNTHGRSILPWDPINGLKAQRSGVEGPEKRRLRSQLNLQLFKPATLVTQQHEIVGLLIILFNCLGTKHPATEPDCSTGLYF